MPNKNIDEIDEIDESSWPFIGIIVFAIFLLCLISFCYGSILGVNRGESKMEIEAVEKGFGQYIVSEYKKVEFRWKDEIKTP